MLTDVSQHRLRQGYIPAEWSDRVRTQTSSSETNSIQAVVMWPRRDRLLSSGRAESSCLLPISLTISLSWYSSLLWKALRSRLQFQSVSTDRSHTGMPEIDLQPQWFIYTARPENDHKGGIPMSFLLLHNKYPNRYTVRHIVLKQCLPTFFFLSALSYPHSPIRWTEVPLPPSVMLHIGSYKWILNWMLFNLSDLKNNNNKVYIYI